MVIFDNNPLDNLDNLKQPAMVIKRGQIYKDCLVKRNEKIEGALKDLFELI